MSEAPISGVDLIALLGLADIRCQRCGCNPAARLEGGCLGVPVIVLCVECAADDELDNPP